MTFQSVRPEDVGLHVFLWGFGTYLTPLGRGWFIPLWLPPAATMAIAIGAWRQDTLARRRARLNLCHKCDYDRAGLANDAACPECGQSPPPSSSV